MPILAAVLLTGCAKGWRPSERAIYSKASAAILALPALPSGAAPLPIQQCRFYIGKSAARIDVPVAAGSATPDFYTAWFKRVARTWELSGPVYRTADPPPGAGSIGLGLISQKE